MTKYKNWEIHLSRDDDGFWFKIRQGQFIATNGPYVGTETVKVAAQNLIDLLLEVDFLG